MPSNKMRSYLIPFRPGRWFKSRPVQKKTAHPGQKYRILWWFGNIIGKRSQGMKTEARNPEEGIMSAPNDSSSQLTCTNRKETVLSSIGSIDELLQTSSPPCQESSNEPAAQSDNEATQTPHYSFTKENKIAVMENVVSILLTEDTLKLMADTIAESKGYQKYEIEYEEMKEKVAAGEAFIEARQSKVDNANLAEDLREQMGQEIQDARPCVLKNIKRREEMENEMFTWKLNLEYKRRQLDDILKQMMTDVGVYERPAPEHPVESGEDPTAEEGSESITTESTAHEARPYESTVSATNASAWEARERLELATQRFTLADDQFNRRHEAYLTDVREWGHLRSRTEIDHYWFRKGAKLTRELIEAEKEYDQARARARALNILANTSDQEFDFADEECDGYRECEDPICDEDQENRSFIEAWTAKVQEEQTMEEPLTPAIEWDAASVNIWDSVSAIDRSAGWRKAIDKWHSQQELLRAQFADLPETEEQVSDEY